MYRRYSCTLELNCSVMSHTFAEDENITDKQCEQKTIKIKQSLLKFNYMVRIIINTLAFPEYSTSHSNGDKNLLNSVLIRLRLTLCKDGGRVLSHDSMRHFQPRPFGSI